MIPSIQAVKIYLLLKGSPDTKFSSEDVSILTGISPRTTRQHLLNLFNDDNLDRDEIRDGYAQYLVYWFVKQNPVFERTLITLSKRYNG